MIGGLVRLTVVAAWAGVLVACGSGDTRPPEEQAAAPAPESTQSAPATVPAAMRPTAQIVRDSGTGFRHGPHRNLVCSNCHQNPPGHRVHADLACLKCHEVPTTLGSMRELGRAECLQCHHVQQRKLACTHCHDTARLGGRHERVVNVRFSVWNAPRRRALTFDHAWHGGIDCQTCHTTPPSYAVQTSCSTCHDKHHQPSATCTRCHALGTEDRALHAEAAHAGCGGSGCHVDPQVAALPPRRALCLVCHSAMNDHESGQECVRCHAVAPTWRGGAPDERNP